VPANADELLRMRGRGWQSSYSVGNPTPDRGLPLVSAFTWDTGVQVHAGTGLVEATASVTTGTVSHPLFHDDNGGKQIAGRLEFHPIAGLIVGASGARGLFVSDAAVRSAFGDDHDNDFTQIAWGTDVEYSRDYYLIRFESIWTAWRLPVLSAPFIPPQLIAWSTSVEGRYKLGPGLYLAARADHLGFSDITGTVRTDSWEAPVTRVEVGGGYSIQRNLILKLAFQHDSRATVREGSLNVPVVQLLFWF
jgi:hypothetical protein